MDYLDVLLKYEGKFDDKVYLVGGAVRDKILKKSIKDFDFTVLKDYKGAAEYLAKEFGGRAVDFEKGTVRVIKDDICYDFSSLRGKNIEEDLAHRDFTINSIAVDINSNETIDPLNGMKDLEYGIIRCSNEKSFIEDPLRILRAFRFSRELNFNMAEETYELIRKSANLLGNVAGERIITELINIFHGDKTYETLIGMDDTGVLGELFPVIKKMKDIGKCKYHLVDSFTHSLLAVKMMEEMLPELILSKNGDNINKLLKERVSNTDKETALKLGVFLHDIGKPSCYSNVDGRISFKMHDVKGVGVLEDITRKIPIPGEIKNIINSIIFGHMRVLGLFKQRSSNKAYFRFFKEFNDKSPLIILASFFDVSATRSLLDPDGEGDKYRQFIDNFLENYFNNFRASKMINGYDAMEATGANGKRLGSIIDKLEEEIFCGNIKSREEALNFLREIKGN